MHDNVKPIKQKKPLTTSLWVDDVWRMLVFIELYEWGVLYKWGFFGEKDFLTRVGAWQRPPDFRWVAALSVKQDKL